MDFIRINLGDCIMSANSFTNPDNCYSIIVYGGRTFLNLVNKYQNEHIFQIDDIYICEALLDSTDKVVVFLYSDKIGFVLPNLYHHRDILSLASESVPDGAPFLICDKNVLGVDLFVDEQMVNFDKPDGYGSCATSLS